MNLVQEIIFLNKTYQILNAEQEFIFHPAALDLLPLSQASLQTSFSAAYHIDDYRLYLDNLTIHTGEVDEKQFQFHGFPIIYNGSVLIAATPVKEYMIKGRLADFTYQNVMELIFEEGVLITTVDQSKAMQRIRKNLELGLRNLTKSRDFRCIRRFMNSSYVGDYKPFLLPMRRMKYLQEMKNINGRKLIN